MLLVVVFLRLSCFLPVSLVYPYDVSNIFNLLMFDLTARMNYILIGSGKWPIDKALTAPTIKDEECDGDSFTLLLLEESTHYELR